MGDMEYQSVGFSRYMEPPPSELDSFLDVTTCLETRVEKTQISGRYHKQPKNLASHYEVSSEVLGSGISGDVHLAANCWDPTQRYAVKAFNFAGLPGYKRAQLEEEVEVFLRMDHPHIARLVDVYESEEHLDLVMECMEGGELFHRVKLAKRFPEAEAAEVAWQMLLALNYVHEHGITHGDVKLENFMFDSESGTHLKLIDFGFSRMFGQECESVRGTVAYLAPECFEFNQTCQADQWAMGVLVFMLLSGYMPFSGLDMQEQIKRGKCHLKKDRWEGVSKPAFDFVKRLLVVNPNDRLTSQEALDHPFIADRHFERRVQVMPSVVDALRAFGHQDKFRRCCLMLMAWSLSNEERSKVRGYFLAMDERHHGALTHEDLQRIMVDHFHVPATEMKVTAEAFCGMHEDHEIHYSDFLAAMVSTHIAVRDEMLHECWDKFDTDSSGYITPEKVESVVGQNFGATAALFDSVPTMERHCMTFHEFASYVKAMPCRHHGDEIVGCEGISPGGLPVKKSFSSKLCSCVRC